VDPFLSGGSGDHLYGMDAPGADGDGAASAPAGREQGGLSAEKPFLGEGQVEALG